MNEAETCRKTVRPKLEAAILDKYTEHGIDEFRLPDVLNVPPFTSFGKPSEIANKFGGAEQLLAAVKGLQEHLYAA